MNRPLIVALAVALTCAACGSDADRSAAHHAPGTPTTAAVAASERIVSLSPTATEILFAVGAGKQVVAADDHSDYPASAPTTKLSASDPSVESIAGYDPDLVILSADGGGVVAQLRKLHISAVVEPAARDLDQAYAQIRDLGRRTGHADRAKEVAHQMETEIHQLVASVPKRAKPLTVFHELDQTLYSATSKTFIGKVYADLGLQNVADAADPNGDRGGYPQLSAERVVQANPDVVFLADTKCCDQDASSFARRPGFSGLRAVRTHHVVGLDDDIASRWGPRVVDFFRAVVRVLRAIPAT